VLWVVRFGQNFDHTIGSLLHFIIYFVLDGLLYFLNFNQRLFLRDLLLISLSSSDELRLLIERYLHSGIHPRLLKLLWQCTLWVNLSLWGWSDRVPDRVHLVLHVRTLLQMLEIISLLDHRLLHHGVLHDVHLFKLSTYNCYKNSHATYSSSLD
jgi:hypothetical protein